MNKTSESIPYLVDNKEIWVNITSEIMTYLIDNRTFLCQHKKLHPLTYRRGKWISEKMYRDIENIIENYSQKYITSEG